MNQPVFESLRRWMGANTFDEPVPLDLTVSIMEAVGIEVGLLAAWYGPQGDLMSNDEVAACVAERPDRLRGVAGLT